jgi:hypothetical protein
MNLLVVMVGGGPRVVDEHRLGEAWTIIPRPPNTLHMSIT